MCCGGFIGDLWDGAVDIVEDVAGAVLDVVEDVGDFVADTVEAIVEDPRKLAGVALAVAFPGAGAALGASLGLTGTAATVVGQALINTAVNGGDVKAAVISAALPVVGKAGTDALSSTLASSGIEGTVNTIITRAATQGATAAILGKDPLSAALLGGVTAGVNAIVPDIPGYNDLPAAAKNAVNSAIATKLTGGNVGGAVSQSLVNDAIAWAKAEVQKVPNAIKAAQATYKADTGETLSDERAAELLGVYGADGLAAAADRLYTSQAEAADIWRRTMGTEPTEFDLMEIIGLDETQAGNIAYDRADTSTEEATDFFKSLYGADYEPTAEQLMELVGRPEGAAKVDAQNLYTKDKNWVTEDEAAQFWKDMGNTGPAPQEFLDAMLMTTENGAKAMAEAHRINAEDIAATTFDGSQYETPQEAAAAAKAAGFNAFTHKDKNLTYFTQPSPIEEANIRADVEEKKTFGEAFAAARKELGAGKTFTWNGKQYTTNVMPKDTFDASRSSTITTAATLALANGKDKFIGPDGKTYKLDDNAKSVLANSVNQSAAETQRLLNLKPTTDETPAETQRLMEAGTRGTMDTIGAMTAQALGTTQRGLGNFLSNAGKTYAAVTGDFDFDNAAIRLGKEIETYAKGNDIYGLDVQKNRMSQALKLADETDDWVEKNKILGSAISKNKIGFFDIAGSEAVEGLPETALQVAAALMTGGTTLAAGGVIAAIGATGSVLETLGSTAEDTYTKAKKAGFSESEARDKAYTSAAIGTAIEAAANFVADKALLAPFLNKFTGSLAGTATGFVSSTAIGAVSDLAAGMGQSFTTQYVIDPATASLSKAATDGFFEMYIGGAAQGTMGLPGYAIQAGSIIGKDYSGRDLTVADVAAGAVLDSSTVDPNTTIATSEDGDPVTLGGAMLQMPNYQFDMSTLKTYVPQVFNNDDLVVGQDELGNTVTYGDLLGQTTESKGFDAVYKSLMDITPEQRTEAKYDYVADLLGDKGYSPTAQEINDLIAQNPAVSKIEDAVIEQYIAPRMVTEQEVRDAYAERGLDAPTQADIDKMVGQYDQELLAGKVDENLGTAQYNSLRDQMVSEEEIQDIVSGAVGSKTTTPTTDDVTAALRVYQGKEPFDAKYDWDGDGKVDLSDTLNLLKSSLGKPTTVPAAEDSFWNQPTGIYKEIKDAIAGIEFPASLTKDDVTDSVAKYMEENPGLSVADVVSAIGTYMTENPGLTAADLDTAISDATKGLATTEQLTELERSLSDEIQAAKDIGLEGDAAIQAGLDSLAEKVGTNQADLLTQLGTTADDLRAQFATDIAASQEATAQEIADARTALETAIADAKAAGLEGDAALQAGIDSVAVELGTTKEALLTQLGTTEETLRTEFATGISGLETQMQEQYEALTTAQRETADALVAQGKTLADAIATAQESTATQIADVETRLTDAIAAAEAAGLTRDEAITSAVESVAADLGTTKADLLTQLGTTEETLRGEFATGLAGVSAEVQAAYDSLSAEQKALATQLTNQGSTLAEAIETVRTETAGQIDTLSADMQAKYDALTDGQKALANDMAQQGLDLTAAINLAAQQTQEQITGLGEQVDLRINELMQQGQTYQEATQQAIGELNTQNQQLQGLVGTQGRSATQDDIDALSQMLGGQRDMDLTYDVTGDKQITQADIDFLTGVVGGTNTDWKAPVGSAWGATGLYGQLAANETQRQADLQAQLAREQQAAAAAAEAQRQNAIRTTIGQSQQGMRSVMDQLQAVQAAGMAPQPVQVVEAGPGLDISDKLNTGFFSGFQAKKEQQKQPQTTKIAVGGYIDDLLAEDMSVDDLLNLLR